MELLRWEVLLHWASVVLYVLATVCLCISTFFERAKLWRPTFALALMGLLPHSVAIGLRWHVSEHGPYMGKYEVLSSTAWVSIAMFLVAAVRFPKLRFTGILVLPYAFLTMTIGLFLNPGIRKLPPSLKSVWLVLHVGFYKLAVGAIVISLAAAIFYLLKEKRGGRGFIDSLPELEVLDHYSYRFASFGFTFWSIGLIAGSIWANQSWGRYWGWDPIETWSLITWLFYGLYLHMRFFFGLRGRRAAWLVVGCFVLSLITAYFMPYVTNSIHTSYFT